MLVHAEQVGHFGKGVVAMDFDPAAIIPFRAEPELRESGGIPFARVI
jgi:hypothetical protein